MGADLGIYVQDSWTIKRLTLNPGVRWEYFNVVGQRDGGRRRALRGLRARSERDPNVPNWNNIAPRFGAGLRPDGRCQDGAEIRRQQVQSQLHDGLREPLQPDGAPDRHAQLVGLRLHSRHVDVLTAVAADQSRQHRAGQRDRAQQQSATSASPRRAMPTRTSSRPYDIEYTWRLSRARCVRALP